MTVSLYTSRIVLNVLGVKDFGIYNVVAGFVTMLAFINNAMASATQRFLAIEIGRKDIGQLRSVFSMSLNIHLLISVAVIIVAETLGLWFINTQLNIPADRMEAARFIYQFSILTLVVNMLSVPYNAMIIAQERMNVFAWVSIVEVSLKLFIIFLLVTFGIDKLKLYAVLVFGVSVLITLIYILYCNRVFSKYKYIIHWNKKLFMELTCFSGWSVFGSLSWVAMGQGLNILLNIFFGPTVNAARGIAFQINGLVTVFVNNIRMAVNPQIIKSFSIGEVSHMNKLVIESAKYSFFLLFLITLPFFLETQTLLRLWLKIVPEYTVIFCQLVLISTLVHAVDIGIVFSAMGRVKENQLYGGLVYIFIVPVSYFFLKHNFSPEIVFIIQIIATLIVDLGVNIYLIKKITNISVSIYFRQLIIPIVRVLLLAIPIPLILKSILQEGIFRIIVVTLVSSLSTLGTVFFFDLDKETRLLIRNKISNKKL
jgi:Na+-driven multidrug efflux pump